jgi:hypothetical protein
LQGQHTFWGGRERKEEAEKNYCQSSFVSWMPTVIDPPCRGWRATSNAALEGYQFALGCTARAIQRAWVPPTCWLVLRTHQPIFLVIKRPEHPWPQEIIARKSMLKNWKYPLSLGQKKSWPWELCNNYIVYKKCENLETPFRH